MTRPRGLIPMVRRWRGRNAEDPLIDDNEQKAETRRIIAVREAAAGMKPPGAPGSRQSGLTVPSQPAPQAPAAPPQAPAPASPVQQAQQVPQQAPPPASPMEQERAAYAAREAERQAAAKAGREAFYQRDRDQRAANSLMSLAPQARAVVYRREDEREREVDRQAGQAVARMQFVEGPTSAETERSKGLVGAETERSKGLVGAATQNKEGVIGAATQNKEGDIKVAKIQETNRPVGLSPDAQARFNSDELGRMHEQAQELRTQLAALQEPVPEQIDSGGQLVPNPNKRGIMIARARQIDETRRRLERVERDAEEMRNGMRPQRPVGLQVRNAVEDALQMDGLSPDEAKQAAELLNAGHAPAKVRAAIELMRSSSGSAQG